MSLHTLYVGKTGPRGTVVSPAPVVHVSVSAKRMFSQFETLSDEELLKIAETEIIDVDAIEISDEEQPDA